VNSLSCAGDERETDQHIHHDEGADVGPEHAKRRSFAPAVLRARPCPLPDREVDEDARQHDRIGTLFDSRQRPGGRGADRFIRRRNRRKQLQDNEGDGEAGACRLV